MRPNILDAGSLLQFCIVFGYISATFLYFFVGLYF